jgi:integrase
MLNTHLSQWAGMRVNDIEHLHITAFLNALPPHAYVKHKNLLCELWAYMVHQGWCLENWPEKTMNAILPDKQRTRHTLEAVMQIRAIAPDYLQRAIDLALHSLQRRADLAKLKRSSVNIVKNTMTVLQQKTLKYANPVYIEIDMHPALSAAVQACLSTTLAAQCPYLLHYRPKRISEQTAGKLHKFAMTEDFLTKEFAKYRDQSGVYDHLATGQRPSFHDLRALGIVIITEQYSKEYAMALAGHADERMWKHYLKGHEGYNELKPVQISYR